MKIEVVKFTNASIEFRCETEADAELLYDRLIRFGFNVTWDRNNRRIFFLYKPDGFATADTLVKEPQRRLTSDAGM